MSGYFKYFLTAVLIFFFISCAENIYILNGAEKIKLYKSKDSSSVSYLIRNRKEAFAADKDLFCKADIEDIASPYKFSIKFENTIRFVDQYSGDVSLNSIYFRIPEGETISGIIIEPVNKEDSFPVIRQIKSIKPEEFVNGIKLENNILHISDAFFIKKDSKKDYFSIKIPDSRDQCSETVIDFDYLSEKKEKVSIIITGKEGSKTYFDYSPLPGRNNIILNSRLFGNAFFSVLISAEKNALSLHNMYSSTDPCRLYTTDINKPVKTGFGPVLFADMSKWRRRDFELYSWNYFPDFLIIDTADYAYQASMFKRLAFYVEKPGSRGIIRTNEEIDNLHGWNAHDYKAADLASFFNEAAKIDILLNKEEEVLKNILLLNNVIKKEGSLYLPGNGGILSVSRESSGYLRRIFITHEGYHGVFFSSAEFRKRCERIWEEVEPEIKDFWKLFFDYKHYDTEDHYLLVNEFMAYNLQQPVDRVLPYFFDHIIPRLKERYPDQEDFLNMLLDEKADEFISNAEKLASALDNVTSLPSGSLILLNKAPDK